jgi:ABC-type amino acid transport substrate-binding protein
MTLRSWSRKLGVAAFALGVSLGLSQAALAASALDQVKQSGVIKVCLAQQQPDNYKDPRTGQWTGVMVDLLNELTKWMKVKAEISEVGWDVAVLSLKQGTCDLFASSIVYTAPRAMEIAFVTPFGAKGDNIIVDKKNPKSIKAHVDLNNPSINIIAELGTREHDNAQLLPQGAYPGSQSAEYGAGHRLGQAGRRRCRGAPDDHRPLVAERARKRRLGRDGISGQ